MSASELSREVRALADQLAQTNAILARLCAATESGAAGPRPVSRPRPALIPLCARPLPVEVDQDPSAALVVEIWNLVGDQRWTCGDLLRLVHETASRPAIALEERMRSMGVVSDPRDLALKLRAIANLPALLVALRMGRLVPTVKVREWRVERL